MPGATSFLAYPDDAGAGDHHDDAHEPSWSDHPHFEHVGLGVFDAAEPVHVGVSALIKTLSKVDPMLGTFHMALGMKVMWNDPRLVDFPEEWDLPEDLWVPNVMMPNTTDVPEDSLYEGMTAVKFSDRKTGLLEWHRNVQAHYSCSFNLRHFPFDENLLAVRFNGSKLRDGRVATAADVVLHAGIPTKHIQGIKRDSPFLLWSDRLEELVYEHELVGIAYSEFVKSNCSFISWGICIRRHTSYYVSKVMLLLWMTTMMSFLTFFSSPADLNAKGELLIGCFTAIVAFLFVINDKLPKTPFLHKLDKLVSLSLFTVFFCAVSAFVTYSIYDECHCWTHFSAMDKPMFCDERVALDMNLDLTPNMNGTVPAVPTPACLAIHVGWVWCGVQFFFYVGVNLALFAPGMWQYWRAAPGVRPPYLSEAKTFVPQKKLIKINLWCEERTEGEKELCIRVCVCCVCVFDYERPTDDCRTYHAI